MKLSVTVSATDTKPVPVSLFTGTFEQKVKKAKKAGFSGIEIVTAFPEKFDIADLNTIYNNGMKVSAFGSGGMYFHRKISLMNEDKKKAMQAKDCLYRTIDIAAIVNGTITIGSFGGRLRSVEKVNKVKEVRDFKIILKDALYYAKKGNVRIAIEPINRYETNFINTVKQGLEFVKSINMENFGMVLDTYHMNIEEKDIEEAVKDANKHIFHVHLGDSNRWPPGYGHFDFKTFIKALKKVKYNGFLSAELLQKPDADKAGIITARNIRNIM